MLWARPRRLPYIGIVCALLAGHVAGYGLTFHGDALGYKNNIQYKAASPCYNFSGSDFAEKTRCQLHDLPPGLWTGSRAGQNGTWLYGTKEVQELLYKNQHPANCRTAKFLVQHMFANAHGLGSTLHVMGFGLAQAIMLGRVYIFGSGGEAWTVGNKFCRPSTRIDDCIILPVSSCSYDEVMDGEQGEPPYIEPGAASGFDEHRVVQLRPARDQRLVPPQVIPLLARGPIPLPPGLFGGNGTHSGDAAAAAAVTAAGGAACPGPFNDAPLHEADYIIQWWRAQSVAYIARPTPRALLAMRRATKRFFPTGAIPPGTIGVHVRRGDKIKEADDAPDVAYFEAAKALHAAGNGRFSRTIYLSTEDDQTLSYFKAQPGWAILYTDVPRHHNRTVRPHDFAREHGLDLMVFHDFISLDLALQCDAWIGAFSSNWPRLIHELRATLRCKAHNVFADSLHGTEARWADIEALW